MTPTEFQYWWQRPWLLALLVVLASAPVWVTTLPPLTDYFGHMGRYRIQLDIADSPFLQRNWAFEWALIANLGVDLLIVPLSALLGLERAIWLIGAALAPLLAWGVLRASRAVHGTVPAATLFALPFALAYPFQYGFVNYWLGLGLGLHLFATWVARSGTDTRGWLELALWAIASVALWVVHVFAWGVLGVFIGGFELAVLLRAGVRSPVAIGVAIVKRGAPLLVPLALMAVWRSNGAGATTEGWFRWGHKWQSLTYTLRDQSQALDIVTLFAALFLILIGLRRARVAIEPRFAIAAFALLALTILFPFQLFGSAYADSRLWPVVLIAFLLALRGDAYGPRLNAVIATAAIALFVARIGLSTLGYAQYQADMSRHLRAVERIDRGARVAVLVNRSCAQTWRRPRLEHLGSVAILRREAFVNSQWDVPGAQLIVPLVARGTLFSHDPSQFVIDSDCPDDMRPRLGERIAAVPRVFDYIWLLDFDPRTLPRYSGLRPVYWDDRSVLYRVDKEQAK